MKRNLLLTALLLASGTALAQTQLETIEVRPTTGGMMEFSCHGNVTPKPIDVEALLQINDRSQTQQLTNKLMGAVKEACARNIGAITVERGKQGTSVIWYPVVGSAPATTTVVTETVVADPVVNADGSVTYPDGTTVYPEQ